VLTFTFKKEEEKKGKKNKREKAPFTLATWKTEQACQGYDRAGQITMNSNTG